MILPSVGSVKQLGQTFAIALFVCFASDARSRDPYEPVEPSPRDALIASFEAKAGIDRTVEFRWRYTKIAKGKTLNCSLNFNGDALADEQIPDCLHVTQHVHQYDKDGRYQASLLVRSRSGGGDMKTVNVEIGNEEGNPSGAIRVRSRH